MCVVILSIQREQILEDTGETYCSVSETLSQILDLQPSSFDDPTFQQAITQAENAPYVATLWLFSPDGKILRGNQVLSEGTVEEFVTEETKRVLAALPKDYLTDDQRTAISVAAVMQAEGEHNDVFRHMIREVYGQDGHLVALLGATYDVSPSIGAAPSAIWILLVLCIVGGLGVYWLSLPLWVWFDARARGERYWIWATFVLIGNLVALMAYILGRTPRTKVGEIAQQPGTELHDSYSEK
jgi:hypothetical protein